MKKKGRNNSFRDSPCPIANLLDIFGDKWSLLIVRDIYHGKHTYGEFLESPERISTNILASRLKRMEESGLITKAAYQNNPDRFKYKLTQKGKELKPIFNAMLAWAEKHLPDSRKVSKFVY